MEGEYIFVDTDGIPICMTCDNSQKLLDDAHAEFAAIQHQYNAILLSNKELTRALCDASVQNNLKTTIIDVLLGVLIPDSGKVLLSNLAPLEAIAKWPGAMAMPAPS